MIHLDTGFLIGALRHGSVEDRRTEFLCGPVELRDVELARQVIDEPVPLLAVDAGTSARLFNLMGRR